MEIFEWIRGRLTVRIAGSSPERFLNMCNHHEIRIWRLRNEADSYIFSMYASDFKRLGAIARKTHMRVKIEKKEGLPFFLFRFRKRQMFFAGIACAAALIVYLSAHIWNIDIEGNRTNSDETLLSWLSEHEVYSGMWKSDVRCKTIAEKLREQFSDFTWVSVALDGTCLFIHVKENTDVIEDDSDASGTDADADAGTDLVAGHTGTVVSVVTRAGTPMVHAGDKVKKGDTLISGAIPIKNDDGEIVSYRLVKADADVIVRYRKSYKDTISRTYEQKNYTGRKQTGYYVRIFGFSFSLGAGKNPYALSDTSTKEGQARISSSFYLPVYYGVKLRREYELTELTYTKAEAEDALRSRFLAYCRKLSEKGVEIAGNNVTIQVNKNEAVMSGKLTLERAEEKSRETELPDIEDGETDEDPETSSAKEER